MENRIETFIKIKRKDIKNSGETLINIISKINDGIDKSHEVYLDLIDEEIQKYMLYLKEFNNLNNKLNEERNRLRNLPVKRVNNKIVPPLNKYQINKHYDELLEDVYNSNEVNLSSQGEVEKYIYNKYL